jgi:hypothetical protein
MYLHEAGAVDAVTIEKINIVKLANRSAEYTSSVNPMGEVCEPFTWLRMNGLTRAGASCDVAGTRAGAR